ncbi:thioesterase [Phaeobacter gallaeciensis]|uniref:Thioesterase n=2 Tax=Roseobacteraceae TaxID=2854170 RepID=A0A366X7P7_9RHOB|nr:MULTISPECIES: thioesterase family protein [Roseobacteraceae]MBT3142612.1 thioesterase family protein [Falsiruegeria litorea]MBT8171018.1 thioesterase family protein [Falsiruegeria litorea]RBW61085.1 thioesterase [Phaeobacter gallaeciensis]
MSETAQSGHDGPYAAPIEVRGHAVKPEWIDYNGHMNVGYYGVAFDLALEEMVGDHLGIGEVYVNSAGAGPYMIQSHIQFQRELLDGDQFYFHFRLLDHDHKRLHYFGQMFAEKDDVLCATQEGMIMNVSQATGRGADYPDWVVARLAQMLADHKALDPAPQVANPIGIRRKI